MAKTEIVVLGDDTPVARKVRRIPRLPRPSDDLVLLWNEEARALPIAPPFPSRLPVGAPRR